MKLLMVVLCCFIAISTAENVTITDGTLLKDYLCPSNGTLPPNTNLVLNKLQLTISVKGDLFCLIENTTNISILPSQEVLSEYVTVHCEGSIGFGFFNVTDLTIKSVFFEGCTATLSPEAAKFVNETSQYLYYDKFSDVSLFLSHCNNVKLYNVSVAKKVRVRQFDYGLINLVGVNLCGISEVVSLTSEDVEHEYRISMPPTLVYYTDSNVSKPSQCDISITSNKIVSSFATERYMYFKEKISHYFDDDTQRIPVTSFGDVALFLTQSFVVNVTLSIGSYFSLDNPRPDDLVLYNPYIAIVFVNSNTSSHVTFQQYSLPDCLNGTLQGSLTLNVVFFETPSFSSSDDFGESEVFSPLLIRNTAFINNADIEYFLSWSYDFLRIVKVSGKLSHEVQLDNVLWCGNNIVGPMGYPMSLLYAENMAQHYSLPQAGHLHLKLNNVSITGVSSPSSQCLMCFSNIKEVTMTGSNTFANNTGGTVINVVSSNLSVSGNLTMKDGYAFEGGAIRLDTASTLYLKEPLMAEFSNNKVDKGSAGAIHAPIHDSHDEVSAIQIWPSKMYSYDNITSIDICLHFQNNSYKELKRSFFAPHFSIFGKQTSPNLMLRPSAFINGTLSFPYTTLINAILHMDKRDKFTSLSNGFCIQPLRQEWECTYIDQYTVMSLGPPCYRDDHFSYNISVYPGQKAFSVFDVDNQKYDIGSCRKHDFQPLKYIIPSLERVNSTKSFVLNTSLNDSVDYYFVMFHNYEVNLPSLPILRLEKKSCPLGFCSSNGTCACDPGFKELYSCNIDTQTFTSQPLASYWTGFSEQYSKIYMNKHCPPNYCTKELKDFQLNDALSESSCVGNRIGVLCGECKENYSVVFGSDTCYSHCTDVYLLTLPVYALAGLLLVLVLFVLRLTVATGTINGVIFYANILALVMGKLTEDMSGHYVMFVRVFFSLLNLDLGFPLCLYEGMTTAGKVGFQFVFPVYLWSIVVGLILLSKFSTRVSKLISTSSVQVLATLFYLSFSKLLHTVIVIFSHSSIDVIEKCTNTSTLRHVWYFDGNDYGNSIHAILLTLAVIFTLLFLLPYALLVTFSSCFVRFQVVNKFRPFFDAYGGPFKDRWRFWFGLRLWITIFLFGLDGALEGTDSDAMFIVHIVIIMVFIMLQGFLRPFKNNLIGLLDASFMMNYWLLIEVYFIISSKSESTYWAIYIFLTAAAAVAVFLVLLFHLCALKYRGNCMTALRQLIIERRDYRVIGRVQEGDSDVDLFNAAEERIPDTPEYEIGYTFT